MVKWTPKAEEDLDEILDYIVKNFNAKLAINIITEIIDYVETTLSSNPLAGHLVASNPLFFKLNFEGNAIYYCENPKDKNLYVVYVRPRTSELKINRISKDEVA